jgi:hypothetical protein
MVRNQTKRKRAHFILIILILYFKCFSFSYIVTIATYEFISSHTYGRREMFINKNMCVCYQK